MSLSLRDEEVPRSGAAPLAQLRVVSAPTFDYEAEIDRVDPRNDPERELHQTISQRLPMRLTIKFQEDGVPEAIELDGDEARAFIEAEPHERAEYRSLRIFERRRDVARASLERLRAAGADRERIDLAQLSAHEEAALRHFNALADREILAESADGTPALIAHAIREDFWGGSTFDAPAGLYAQRTSLDNEYTPRGSPATQQLFINDVWDMQAKAWWAWHHDPIAKKGIGILVNFTLGRGISIDCDDDEVQAWVDRFMKREKMGRRLKGWITALFRDGDLFLRQLDKGNGDLAFRKLPCETIVEIITDAEDAEAELAFVQRYQTRTQTFSTTAYPRAAPRYVQREIPGWEMIHEKVNSTEEEIRGRSDLFAALPWLKRLRDYFDSRVQKAQAEAAYQWDYEVDGGVQDLARFAAQIPAGKVDAGSYFLHNKQAKITAVSPGMRDSSGNGDSTYDALVTHIANALNLNPGYFGVGSKGGRATALVGSEPDEKEIETRQDKVIDLVTDVLSRVIRAGVASNRINASKITNGYGFRISMPAIIKSDAQTRQTMIDRAESMNHLSKKTAANLVYGELGADGVDFEAEQKQIALEAQELANNVISIDLQQVAKGAQPLTSFAAADREPPEADEIDTDDGNASPTSGRGAGKIRRDLGREAGGRAALRMSRNGRPEIVIRP